MSREDRAIRGADCRALAALAVIAVAVSYAHMVILAERHGETGWLAHAFPLSVDGIEIVASLVLLADRRVGRRSGWLAWAALAAGTAASVAANVAVGATDPVSRVVAGWPAFALLVAIKLLPGLVDHPVEPSGTVSALRTPDDVTTDDGPPPGARPWTSVRVPNGDADADGSRTAPDPDDLADLLPAAGRAATPASGTGDRVERQVHVGESASRPSLARNLPICEHACRLALTNHL